MHSMKARRLACLSNVHLTRRTARLIYLGSYHTLSVPTMHPHIFFYLLRRALPSTHGLHTVSKYAHLINGTVNMYS